MTPASRPNPRPSAPPEFFATAVGRARRFYLDLKPSRAARLVVVCGGREHCSRDYVVQRADFAFHSLEYVARGHGGLTLAGQEHALDPGRLFSYGPGIPHHIRGTPGDAMVKYFVDFAGREARSLLRSAGLAPGSVSRVHPPHVLQAIFDELIEAGLGARRRRAELCTGLLECLALKIQGTQMPGEDPGTLSFLTYQQCREHLERHFLRLRTLEETAAECHVSVAHLCRLFRRYDRQTPYQYLLRLKMQFAAECLEQEGCLVKQAAEEAGFADPFHFSRVFKSVLGVSPGAFRGIR
jgi:AraC-like DNA-binding protein